MLYCKPLHVVQVAIAKFTWQKFAGQVRSAGLRANGEKNLVRPVRLAEGSQPATLSVAQANQYGAKNVRNCCYIIYMRQRWTKDQNLCSIGCGLKRLFSFAHRQYPSNFHCCVFPGQPTRRAPKRQNVRTANLEKKLNPPMRFQ